MASELPAIIKSRSLSFRSEKVGLITISSSTKPTRTAAIGFENGIDEIERAAEAPVSARTSESFSGSADNKKAMTYVSRPQPSGNNGRSGRSMSRLVRTSFSVGLASRLKNPPGIRPEA